MGKVDTIAAGSDLKQVEVQSEQARREPSQAMQDLFQRSRGADFGLTADEFSRILQEIGVKYLPAECSDDDLHSFSSTLKIEELALARACAMGRERAWEVFLTRYREKLYEIAGYIAREAATARELADSIYADLYGTVMRDGQRVSKLNFYTGRGSLEGWLRTVLAQEFINRYRRQKKLVSLEEEAEEGVQFASPEPASESTIDGRVHQATDRVLESLPAEDRFLLSAYYLDQRTLAEIGRTLGVHESTISRKLDKLAKSLRKQILAALGKLGMSRRQAQEALESDVRDLRVNIRARLA
ncbi:MAG: sigma-70 family RNA polymerase sigma factor, partial [Acidobacteriales bacterium]|nr:sigma-70 family RNA polymerase sigma factor [Terriglobales bacterium]